MAKPNKEKLQALLKEYSLIPDYGGGEVGDINKASPFGLCPIHYAASRGSVEEIEILLEFGADINARGEYGLTPLHYATMQGFVDAVKFLSNRGADPSIKNDDGNTVLELAGLLDEEEVEIILLENETDIDLTDEEDGSTLLHRSASDGHMQTAQYLIGRGADINCQDKDGFTPLHCAVEEEQAATVRFLLFEGADPSIKNHDGDTPLDIARILEHEGITAIFSEDSSNR